MLRRRSSRAAAVRLLRGLAGKALVGRRVASRQRIVLAVVQPSYPVAIESLFLDFEMRAEQMRGRELLDREADRLRRLGKTPIGHRPVALAAAGRKQLRRCAVVKSIHVYASNVAARHRAGKGKYFPQRRACRSGTCRSAERVGQERAGKASELHPAGGTGGDPSSQSSWYARVSKERCMRSRSSRSAADLALAAKTPHA